MLIWIVGQTMLGAYANGSATRLLADFFAGLRRGSLIHWIVVIGPYVFVLILRGFWLFIQRTR